MNNKNEIEKMARIIKPFVTVLCEEDTIAEALVNAGYGNVKQAVKEFAEKLKEKMELNGYRSLLHNRIIDNLITELYGAGK